MTLEASILIFKIKLPAGSVARGQSETQETPNVEENKSADHDDEVAEPSEQGATSDGGIEGERENDQNQAVGPVETAVDTPAAGMSGEEGDDGDDSPTLSEFSSQLEPVSFVVADDDDSYNEIPDPPARAIVNMETTRQAAFDAGCDSDGENAPRNNTPEEEKQMVPEKALPEKPPSVDGEGTEINIDNEEDEAPPNIPAQIPPDVLSKLTVPQLKEQLQIRNVTYPSRLTRPKLLERLNQSLHLPVVGTMNGKKSVNKKARKKDSKVDDLSEFAPGAYWSVLKPQEAVVQEPTNPSFQNARAPTVPAAEANKVPVNTKHNFSDAFDRPAFTGKRQVLNVDSTTGDVIKDADGKPAHKTEARERGGPKLSFLKRHQLDKDSHPAEFFDAFMPLKLNEYRNQNNDPCASTSDMQQWTNMKAMLSNAGSDECYSDYKPFTVKEAQQHLGLYTLNGLSPSPTMELKFDVDDEANYNHFVASNVDNGVRRHRMFRAFFSVQDPRKPVPSRKVSPLFKVLPLIDWLNAVGKASWDLGINLSVDEQTMSFQGRHGDKLRITYKAEGDGFQVDALCDRGFTHSVYFRNELPPKKHLKEGLSPLHARVMWLFDRIEAEFTRAWMDNLYISAKFAKFAYNHKMKILIAGVARMLGRGIPLSVVQQEMKDPAKRLLARGTVKAAVLQGDDSVPNLVAVSVYDAKPVHFTSTICEGIEWVLKTRKVWNEAKKQMEKLQFLRLNVNNDYNQDMNAVDISDQLRNNYRFDHWLRNFKWWWSILLWAVGVLMVNSCVTYTSVMDEAKVPKKFRLTHCQFRLAIARVWIDKNGVDRIKEWKQRRLNPQQHTPVPISGDKRSRSPALNTPSPSTDSVNRCGSATTPSGDEGPKRKSPRLDDSTLSIWGNLKGRLDFFRGRRHLPMTREAAGETSNTKCALHRWACGRECEFRTGVMVCQDCEVALCFDCYSIFHTEPDLVGKKEQLKGKMEESMKKKKAKAPLSPQTPAKQVQTPKTTPPKSTTKKKKTKKSTPTTPTPSTGTGTRTSNRNRKQSPKAVAARAAASKQGR